MEQLIIELKKLGVSIGIQGDQLKLDIPNGVDIQPFVAEIRANKPAIIDFIRKIKGEQHFKNIRKADERVYYPLSSSQQRMFFLQQLAPASLVYNMPQVLWVKGQLNIARLENAFRQLISRHEGLRTIFPLADEMPVQQVLQEMPFELEKLRIQDEDPRNCIQQFIRSFDLHNGPLIRAGVITREQTNEVEEVLLIIDLHHIISDGISGGVIMRDLNSLYNDISLAPLHLQYKDFSMWMQSAEQEAEISRHKDFWQDTFALPYEVPQLPAAFKRPAVKSYRSALLEFALPAYQLQALRQLAKEENVTMFMLFLSVYNILLSKLSHAEDWVVGTPIAGRSHPDLEGIVGLFVNTLPIRNFPKGEISFRDFLQKVKTSAIDSFDHQLFPYEALVEVLKVQRELNRNPLFDVFYLYEYGKEQPEGEEMFLRPFNTGHQLSQFDLTLAVKETDKGANIIFEYACDLYDEVFISDFKSYFLQIAESVIVNRNILLQEILLQGTGTQLGIGPVVNFPKGETMMSLFAKQAIQSPDNIALVYTHGRMTYGELYTRSLKVAAYLHNTCGIKRGEHIGVLLEREEWLIPVIYGILMADAVYIPLALDAPAKRVCAMVEDAGISRVVTRGTLLQYTLPVTIVDLDLCREEIMEMAAGENLADSASLAYVIHTSGSTGKPKGVMIEHHAIVNRLWWMQRRYPLTSEDVLIQKTPVSFDVSVWELFWWSMTGAALHLLVPGGEKEPETIMTAIAENKVSVIHFVPSMLGAFLAVLESKGTDERLRGLHTVFCSGEALKPHHVEAFRKTLSADMGTRLINLYGPTEATVDVTYYECDTFGGPVAEDAIIPIGEAIDNIRLYLLDKKLLPVLPGMKGELCIAGVGLARGYLGNEALTQEKFTTIPGTSERIYRTGDSARWMRDGKLEYLGRMDKQVKIRGYRIEPGEVEMVLLRHEEISEAAVIAYAGDGEDYKLAAFVRITQNGPGVFALRKYLRQYLPDYMLPATIQILEKMPVNANGKLDRKMLEQLAVPAAVKSTVTRAPASIFEKEIAAIWEELLGVKNIGLQDNFFDLGGHSIMLVKNNLRMENRFGVSLPFTAFISQNLEQIAGEISRLVGKQETVGK